MSQEDKKIIQLRKAIDALDDDLLKIINTRAQYAIDVAAAKRKENDGQPFYRSNREADVLRRMRQANAGPLSNEEVMRLFQEIMSACLALEQPMKIGYLGPEATFTHQAALKHFGHSVNDISLNSIEEVFRQIEKGQIEYGVVPIENSTEGVVSHTLDQFVVSPVKIIGEIQLHIHHYLFSKCDQMKDVQVIYSHPQPFAQCRQWLNQYASHCEQVPLSSTAAAARKANEEAHSAAICSDSVLQHYKELQSLCKNIEDESNNRTRFLVIGSHAVAPSSCDKTSLLLSTQNKPGALAELLKSFARHGVSLTRIESRPAKTSSWDYIFFVDALGHVEQEPMKLVMEELEQQAQFLKFLGSYPCSILHDSNRP
ncbi:MAG: prephenate dehydratase [Candidatus Oxydemutatoraceae bacterium WSBS_2016_MAG_OTU14]